MNKEKEKLIEKIYNSIEIYSNNTINKIIEKLKLTSEINDISRIETEVYILFLFDLMMENYDKYLADRPNILVAIYREIERKYYYSKTLEGGLMDNMINRYGQYRELLNKEGWVSYVMIRYILNFAGSLSTNYMSYEYNDGNMDLLDEFEGNMSDFLLVHFSNITEIEKEAYKIFNKKKGVNKILEFLLEYLNK